MPKDKIKLILSRIISFGTPLILIYFFDIFYRRSNQMLSLYIPIKPFLISLLIGYSFFFLVFGIFKSTAKANIAMSVTLFIFSIVNQLKIMFTNEPIVLADFLYLNTAGEITTLVKENIFNYLGKVMGKYWVFLVIGIVLGFLNIKCSYRKLSLKYRLIAIFIPIMVMVIIHIPSARIQKFMVNKVYDSNESDYKIDVSNIKYIGKYGVLSGMYLNVLENRILEPSGYDDAKIESIINQEYENDTSFGKPNIIVIFAESFWDISKLDEIEFDTEITGNLNNLKNEGIYFEMLSPTYGGISANVEFEFLTGANLMYFNRGFVPYMQLYTNDSYYNRPSLIDVLNRNGYTTKIDAYTSGNLADTESFYNYIGVDDYHFKEYVSKKNKKGKYVSDEYVIDQIIERFNHKDPNERLFYMALTMQAHMPYYYSKYSTYDMNITSSNLEDKLNKVVLSYAQGIYDTDKQLGRLYDYINTLNEPTMIVFYGDHLPFLQAKDGTDVIDYLEYFNTNDESLNTFRLYNTQSIILANFDIKEDDLKYISPDMLGVYLINRMDVDVPNYYKYVYSTRLVLPCANYFLLTDNNGNIYDINSMPKDMKEVYNNRQNVQYKFFVK